MRRGATVKVLAVLVVVCSSTLAWPCSGPLCEDLFRGVPGYSYYIPANAPAVGVQTALFSERSWDGGSVSMSSQLISASLHFPDGGSMLMPTSVLPEGVFFSPPGGFVPTDLGSDGGVPPGDGGPNRLLRLQWEAQGVGGPCVNEQSFGILPPAALPTVSATLHFTNFRMETFPSGNLCGGPTGTVQYADLAPEPDSEMQPWLPLTRWELEIDGENWSATNYGSFGAYRPPEAMHSLYNFHVQCVDGGLSGDARLQPGPHEARVLAYIAGLSAPIPSNTLSIIFDCVSDSSVLPDGGLRPDGGFDGGTFPAADGGSDAGSSPIADGGTSDGGVSELRDAPPSCGCQTASFAWAPLVSLLLFWRRRSRP